jgi:hypothetical protein
MSLLLLMENEKMRNSYFAIVCALIAYAPLAFSCESKQEESRSSSPVNEGHVGEIRYSILTEEGVKS